MEGWKYGRSGRYDALVRVVYPVGALFLRCIRLTYRPRGAPQVGGHIERLIGTFMHRIHLVPGTTFSNVAEKGGYDSEGQAVMTLKELERWLALEILGIYHQSEKNVSRVILP
jgi:hypothetical protein